MKMTSLATQSLAINKQKGLALDYTYFFILSSLSHPKLRLVGGKGVTYTKGLGQVIHDYSILPPIFRKI